MTYYDDIEFVTACVGVAGSKRMNHLSGRSYHTLQYQHYGRIRFAINGEREFVADAPSLLITRPGASCHFGSEEQPWHHNYIGVRGARVERMVVEGLLPLTPGKECEFVRIKDGEAFLALFRQCVSHVRAGAPHRSRLRGQRA